MGPGASSTFPNPTQQASSGKGVSGACPRGLRWVRADRDPQAKARRVELALAEFEGSPQRRVGRAQGEAWPLLSGCGAWPPKSGSLAGRAGSGRCFFKPGATASPPA